MSVAWPRTKVPEFTSMVPVKELLALRVSVPFPYLVTFRGPEAPEGFVMDSVIVKLPLSAKLVSIPSVDPFWNPPEELVRFEMRLVMIVVISESVKSSPEPTLNFKVPP